MEAAPKNTRVSFGRPSEPATNYTATNINDHRTSTDAPHKQQQRNEAIEDAAEGATGQQEQTNQTRQLSQVEQNQRSMVQRRKASQSTPNLQKMELNERNRDHHPPKRHSVATSANLGTTATTRSTMRRCTSVSNMKRSRSELILLSPEFRTRLMNEQKERDPLFYYRVQKTIGNGSMGSVALVKKRSQTVGGSARKVVREAVQTHKRKQKCFQLPFGIGGLFRLCIEDELRVQEDKAPTHSKTRKQNRHHRVGGTKNALLSVETWLGSSEGSSDVSSCDSTSTAGNPAKQGRRRSSILFPADDSTTAASTASVRSALDVEYAMKSIHLSRITDDTFVQELENEIAILKKLDHPHIVRPLETFHYRNQIFIVMEHCSGGDLYSRDPYTEEEAARHISSILSAVGYLHANNVAHRDLKYENILFVNDSPKAEIKLIDFGLSKVYGGGVNGKSQTLTEGVGTIYTMAPEVLKGSYTKQADVWSVGVIAYMLLSSQMPFYGRKRQHIVEQILAGKYDFRGRRWRRVSTPAKDFVRDLLVLDPDERLDAERASSCVWLNKRFSASVRGPRECEILQARNSMMRYVGYTKLKKMALMVVAHRSTCEEIGILRKVFQKYASIDKGGCISYEGFNSAWKESGLPPEDTRAIFDSVDLDGSGLIQYTEFLAATIEAQGAISEERLAEAFDRFDSDDSGHISVDNLAELLGKDFSRQEIIDIIGDAVDPDNGGDGTSNQMISYSAFLSLWEKNHEKEVRANKLRMLGSQANLCQLGDDGFDDVEDTDVDSPHYSMENCEEAAKARATFLMDKHGTLRNSNAQEQKKLIVVEQPILEDGADFDDSFTVDGGIQI
ncbi:unnamed protein product [Pseudo-nitzschia multistriata]|uniref:Uncharacterized protein n=1 Tax=Pseudo-nitzschia multistriata TaxID=183589 RepID=A0A448ZG77_9STRA|nr:unnamed protein product [Pseudo-nitzschia multistriata]